MNSQTPYRTLSQQLLRVGLRGVEWIERPPVIFYFNGPFFLVQRETNDNDMLSGVVIGVRDNVGQNLVQREFHGVYDLRLDLMASPEIVDYAREPLNLGELVFELDSDDFTHDCAALSKNFKAKMVISSDWGAPAEWRLT